MNLLIVKHKVPAIIVIVIIINIITTNIMMINIIAMHSVAIDRGFLNFQIIIASTY
jgi:hypothetical protein